MIFGPVKCVGPVGLPTMEFAYARGGDLAWPDF